EFNDLAGASGGALVAALLAAGYSAVEISKMLLAPDFARVIAPSRLRTRVPLAGKYLNLATRFGMSDGDALLRWVRYQLSAQGIRTFGDLKMKLKLVATDISCGRRVNLPEDSIAYSIDPDELDVALAVRMSMSIPFVLEPVTLKNTSG